MKLLKRRLDHCWFVVTLASLLNRDKDKSLVFVPFQNSLLGLVFLLVPNSEYTMTLQVKYFSIGDYVSKGAFPARPGNRFGLSSKCLPC